ncbi:MAG: Gfo/Idh/MocA family oxidoreductase [Bacteroidales bacterium]|nr:Gfo/Idh/MocA family oxidoreductase [Bacteroidales bacterium]
MTEKNETVDLGLRKFIKDLGIMAGGATLLATAPWLKSCTPETVAELGREKARIGMIGVGSRGQYHIHNLLKIKHAQIVALCDVYQVNLDAAHALVPGAKTYTDYHKMLEDKDIDGVIISTPLGTHAQITLDSMSAGKHVFCEKSMARTFDECKAIYDAYTKGDRALYYCMQRMYDEKYIKAIEMIKGGLIGDVVGMRCHWFRNADWRRPVPSPELERQINWRLYKESSGGLMTELATHQLEICTWAAGKMPSEVVGFGDIVYWKDGREVYDSVSLTYHFSDGRKINYESLISNKFNGMEDQILGNRGTVDLSKGVYYLEDDNTVYGMRQLLDNIKTGIFAAVPTAGPSWRPEYKSEYIPHALTKTATINPGQSMIGVDADGSDLIVSAFCQSCITGEKVRDVVEEAYCATTLCLLGNEAMEKGTKVVFPDEYKIPYMKF